MRKPRITKGDAAVIVMALIGVLLQVPRIPHVRGVGIYLLIAAFIIGAYRIYKKARAEGKEVVF